LRPTAAHPCNPPSNRATPFNFSENYFRDFVLEGEVALPAGNTPEPFVDAEDIADVAVAALTDDRHIGELYELTGPHPSDRAAPAKRRRNTPRCVSVSPCASCDVSENS
jgi:uncharacterized protein YbjT (DUF2867 family)